MKQRKYNKHTMPQTTHTTTETPSSRHYNSAACFCTWSVYLFTFSSNIKCSVMVKSFPILYVLCRCAWCTLRSGDVKRSVQFGSAFCEADSVLSGLADANHMLAVFAGNRGSGGYWYVSTCSLLMEGQGPKTRAKFPMLTCSYTTPLRCSWGQHWKDATLKDGL